MNNENNRPPGEVISIGRGSEIKVEKSMNRVREVRDKAQDALKGAIDKMTEIESILEDLKSQSVEDMDMEAIALYEKDIKTLADVETNLLNYILMLSDNEAALREQWLAQIERSEAITEISTLNEIMKELKKVEDRK
ncbi:hypothetical protein HQ524_01150 [Candidatus Uhrbacteria bacterium]|nr:hypothetical protein [Candidatus Uhrbacteria bacterium]